MQHFEYSNSSPAHLLACDHAILDEREENGGENALIFWESPSPFVVLGYTDRAQKEANFAACRAENISILRRCSGGGTVVQGRGCLSYSLVLRIPQSGALSNLSDTNRFIMQRTRDALQPLLSAKIEVHGVSDLTANGRKFSGNAQRRRRNFLLFHGTFLLDFDLDLLFRVLEMPSRQPQYRAERSHRDFVTNLVISPYDVKEALRTAWNAPIYDEESRITDTKNAGISGAETSIPNSQISKVEAEISGANRVLESVPQERIERLVRDVYTQDSWNFKF